MDARTVPYVSELSRRPLRRDDVVACVDLLAAAEAVDRTGENVDAADVAHELGHPGVDLDRDSLAVLDGGRLVAFGIVVGASHPRVTHHVRLWGTVHPQWRRRGIGRDLLGWQRERGRALHAERHPARAAQLEVWVSDHVPGAVALAQEGRLARVRHWFEMECELTGEPGPPVPSPLPVMPFDPARDDEVRVARNDAFADHYGSSPRDAQEWRQYFTGDPAFRPDLSLLALDGERVAGCLLAYVYAADTAATGILETWVGTVGVRPGYRGRGVASALLAAGLRRFRDAGCARAGLGVDAANATGAVGLYERLGFRTVRTTTTWAEPVPAHDVAASGS